MLDNINTALAKSNFINMAPIFGSRSENMGHILNSDLARGEIASDLYRLSCLDI